MELQRVKMQTTFKRPFQFHHTNIPRNNSVILLLKMIFGDREFSNICPITTKGNSKGRSFKKS